MPFFVLPFIDTYQQRVTKNWQGTCNRLVRIYIVCYLYVAKPNDKEKSRKRKQSDTGMCSAYKVKIHVFA